MENSRSCYICNIDVHSASFAKHRTRKHSKISTTYSH